MSYLDRRYTAERAEHEYDDARAARRPTDPITSLDVCLLVRGIRNPTEGAALIEQYAKTIAAGARLDGVAEAGQRILQLLERAHA